MENYALEMQKIISKFDKNSAPPSLLLHSCCAPCSSSVIEQLASSFDITVYFYNPNIAPNAEYERRKEEQKRLLTEKTYLGIKFVEADYNKTEFFTAIKGLEHIKEGGDRCFACFNLRLSKAMHYANEMHFDYFCSTLTVSPHKNAQKINEIGFLLSKNSTTKFLPSDFKKNNGYKRSLELSKEYNLYRQDYCGCGLDK